MLRMLSAFLTEERFKRGLQVRVPGGLWGLRCRYRGVPDPGLAGVEVLTLPPPWFMGFTQGCQALAVGRGRELCLTSVLLCLLVLPAYFRVREHRLQ